MIFIVVTFALAGHGCQHVDIYHMCDLEMNDEPSNTQQKG
jgi:hypothetical protein